MNNGNISRRTALKHFLAGAGAYAVTAGVPGVVSKVFASESVLTFPQGVASGDPQPDALVFWTRAVEAGRETGAVNVRFQVSASESFEDLTHDQTFSVDESSDYCLRVLLDGLKPDTRYFYRFGTETGVWGPLTGRSRTAPAPDADRQVRFAFASCQDYKERYFGAWRRLVEDDKALPEEDQLDFVLHLGDFIYEGAKTFGTGPRELPPFPSGGITTPSGYVDALTLEDYRHLYKLYLSDPDLQAARARFPFVCTWDDHEFSNDSWQANGSYFKPGRAWPDRKAASNQAWFEFIPAILTEATEFGGENPASDFDGTRFPADVSGRPVGAMDGDHQVLEADARRAVDSMTIYRVLQFGRHVDLVITDSRSYRSQQPLLPGMPKNQASYEAVRLLDAGREANDGNPPDTIRAGGKVYDNPRKNMAPGTVLGPKQKNWFKSALVNSKATWKIWGNSIPLTSLKMDISSVDKKQEDTLLAADAWDGYNYERRELMSFIRDQSLSNLVSFSGDHHMHMASIVPVDPDEQDLKPAIAEFAVASITSRNAFEAYEKLTQEKLPQMRPLVTFEHDLPSGRKKLMENLNFAIAKGTMAAGVMAKSGLLWLAGYFTNKKLNRHLRFLDTASHGFGLVSVNANRMTVNLVCTDDPFKDFGQDGAPELYRASFYLPSRDGDDTTPRVNGPEFSGLAPFPYKGWDGTSTKGRGETSSA